MNMQPAWSWVWRTRDADVMHDMQRLGEYQQALEDYRAAGDAASIVRILLGPLQRPSSAADLARHFGSQAALRQVADHMLATAQPQVRSKCIYHACSLVAIIWPLT